MLGRLTRPPVSHPVRSYPDCSLLVSHTLPIPTYERNPWYDDPKVSPTISHKETDHLRALALSAVQ